jgi:hypothetical protein
MLMNAEVKEINDLFFEHFYCGYSEMSNYLPNT